MPLTTGRLAERASVNVETIRYYERRGLIAELYRTRAGYRQYPEDAPTRIRFIKRAQRRGFTLTEIRELLALRVEDEATCASVEERAVAKVGLIRKRSRRCGRCDGPSSG